MEECGKEWYLYLGSKKERKGVEMSGKEWEDVGAYDLFAKRTWLNGLCSGRDS